MLTKRTIALLAVLAVVSVALLGGYFWIAILLCALLYVANAAKQGTGGERGVSSNSLLAWLGVCALLPIMIVIMANRGGVIEDGVFDGDPGYSLEVREEGDFSNGAEGLRVFARTGADSEAEWRELASEISRENGSPDFLWVDVLEESTDEPRAVITVFGTREAAEALGNGSFGPDGGRAGDGVYVFGREELRDRDYSLEMDVFGPA